MLTQVEAALPALSPAERRVGQWILKHPRQAAHAAVADVAAAAGTSQPTVIRFCRSLTLSGFRELKIRLAEDLSRPVSYLHRDVDRDDRPEDAVGKVLDRSIQALLDTRAQAANLPFAAAVAALAAARQVLFAGSGASGHVAADACHKFFRLGLPCAATTDVPTMLQQSAIAGARDVFVLVSQSGQSQGVVAAAGNAHRQGATIIALTERGTPLAALATLLFPHPAVDEASVYTPMSSRLALLAVLDALQVATALALGAAAEERLRESKAALAAGRVPLAR